MHTRIVMSVMVVAGVVMMAGCGGGAGDGGLTERSAIGGDELIGAWQLHSYVTPVMTEIVLEAETADSLVLSFNADRTLELMELSGQECVATSRGSWSREGGRVEVGWSSSDVIFAGVIRGGTLILSANEGTADRVEMHFMPIDLSETVF
ncbi:MAG: hypothetical protein ACOX9R_17235 [Armatimonadota bacterium]|jgi:hypothetical protein